MRLVAPILTTHAFIHMLDVSFLFMGCFYTVLEYFKSSNPISLFSNNRTKFVSAYLPVGCIHLFFRARARGLLMFDISFLYSQNSSLLYYVCCIGSNLVFQFFLSSSSSSINSINAAFCATLLTVPFAGFAARQKETRPYVISQGCFTLVEETIFPILPRLLLPQIQ
jgi:hypothetical protein